MIDKLIIFGSNGMLGRYLKKYFSRENIELILVTRNEYEITSDNLSNLEHFLVNLSINDNTCIVNCTGLIPQRMNKKDNANYYIINSIFPLHLSKLCDKYKTKLICPTTDCVFSGKKGKYVESDFQDEINAYGQSKSLGEPMNATVIRTSIIGEELENKKSFLEFVKNSDSEINGWDDHYWNGISCYQYCKIIDKIIKENLFWKGIRHIYSPESKSKYELACIIKDVYKLPININKYISGNIVDKTLYSEYDTNNIFNIPTLDVQIDEQSTFSI